MSPGRQNIKTTLLAAGFTGQDHGEAGVDRETLSGYFDLYAVYSGRSVGAVALLILSVYPS